MKKFEEKMIRLEEINQKIKDRDLKLEEAVKLFEEGVKLSSQLEKDLKGLDRKVEILINQPQDPEKEGPELELFTDQGI